VNLAELLAEMRSRLDDEATPYLWSDADLTLYLNEAEREACIRAKLLYDSTTPQLTQYAITAGAQTIALDSRIDIIDRVQLDGRFLKRHTVEQIQHEYGPLWQNWSPERSPRYFIHEDDNQLRIFRPPAEDGTLRLYLWRLPLADMEAPADVPDISVRFHLQMIDWAEHLAYRRRDADAGDSQKAIIADQRFTATFGIRPTADTRRKQRVKRVPIVRPHW
jgi:hypothetical protein